MPEIPCGLSFSCAAGKPSGSHFQIAYHGPTLQHSLNILLPTGSLTLVCPIVSQRISRTYPFTVNMMDLTMLFLVMVKVCKLPTWDLPISPPLLAPSTCLMFFMFQLWSNIQHLSIRFVQLITYMLNLFLPLFYVKGFTTGAYLLAGKSKDDVYVWRTQSSSLKLSSKHACSTRLNSKST